MSTDNPIIFCGFTSDRRPIIGGAFHMADTMGVPLAFLMDEAETNGCVISIPHFFACAIAAGWDDQQTFNRIREAIGDRGRTSHDMESIERECMALFMRTARAHPELKTAIEIAAKMREILENPRSPSAVSATSAVS